MHLCIQLCHYRHPSLLSSATPGSGAFPQPLAFWYLPSSRILSPPSPPCVGLATWCATHAAESRGCRVVVRNSSSSITDNILGSNSSSSTSWAPCPHEPPPHSTTCSHHADLDEQYGAAAGFEAHGALARPTVRLDQLPGAAEGREGGSQHLLSPLTPSPGGSRGGQGLSYRRGECLQGCSGAEEGDGLQLLRYQWLCGWDRTSSATFVLAPVYVHHAQRCTVLHGCMPGTLPVSRACLELFFCL